MSACLFCKIAKGEIPAKKVFENESALVFLDAANDWDGHMLAIPKKHAENIFDCDAETLHQLADAVQLVSKHCTACGFDGVNLLNASGKSAGQSVQHFHIHILPRKTGDGANAWPRLPGAEKTSDEMLRILSFKSEYSDINFQFHRISHPDQLDECLAVIRKSFLTVAEEFGLTEAACPSHPAFLTLEKLQKEFREPTSMFLCRMENQTAAGYFSLHRNKDNSAQLEHLAVLPEYRRCGIGKAMIQKAQEIVRANGGSKITVGILEENEALKRWYQKLGFLHTGTKKFGHLPFTVGFMELNLESHFFL